MGTPLGIYLIAHTHRCIRFIRSLFNRYFFKKILSFQISNFFFSFFFCNNLKYLIRDKSYTNKNLFRLWRRRILHRFGYETVVYFMRSVTCGIVLRDKNTRSSVRENVRLYYCCLRTIRARKCTRRKRRLQVGSGNHRQHETRTRALYTI